MAYVTVDGQRVAEAVARSLAAMNAEFKNAFGLEIKATSGTRTYEEQKAIFLARYVLAGQINGRRVYDTRWWNGALWYRISSAGTVAQPGTSNHEEDGPNGPRSIDIRDTGSDYGVTRAGTIRSNWIKANAHRFQFNPDGFGFGEPWHITWNGADPHGGAQPAPTPPNAPPSQTAPNVKQTLLGWNWNGIAAMLRATGRYRGNNQPGPNMFAAFQDFLNDSGYSQRAGVGLLKLDGDPGDKTAKAIQGWLKWRPWGYTGAIDGWLGGGSHTAWNKAEAANWLAFPNNR